MPPIIFATSNDEKFLIAQAACLPHGIELVQRPADIDEIQSENLEAIIRDKAGRAHEKLRQPVIVSDDAWSAPALRGFPGPYMKSIDHWFTPQNWLDLTRSLGDKRIILITQLAYQDGQGCQLFRREYTGHFLADARGAYGKTLQKVVTMPGDDGLSIAEVYDHAGREVIGSWQDFIRWYSEHHAKV